MRSHRLRTELLYWERIQETRRQRPRVRLSLTDWCTHSLSRHSYSHILTIALGVFILIHNMAIYKYGLYAAMPQSVFGCLPADPEPYPDPVSGCLPNDLTTCLDPTSCICHLEGLVLPTKSPFTWGWDGSVDLLVVYMIWTYLGLHVLSIAINVNLL